MDVWVTLLAALGPALGKALYDVGKEVVRRIENGEWRLEIVGGGDGRGQEW